MGIVYGPKWPFYSCYCYIRLFGTGFMQVLYLGRAPRTKETLPDFREKCRVTRHLRVFRGLTGSQRIPEFWGVTIFVGFASHFFLLRDQATYKRRFEEIR